MDEMLQKVGVVAAVAMPFWNIPLMVRIFRRKDSRDISLWWAWGVWACIALMFPSSINSSDPVLRAFGWVNTVMFSLVVVVVMLYRKGPKNIV